MNIRSAHYCIRNNILKSFNLAIDIEHFENDWKACVGLLIIQKRVLSVLMPSDTLCKEQINRINSFKGDC